MMPNAFAGMQGSHLAQFMAPLSEHVADAAGAVGNTADVAGAAFEWDGLPDALEPVRWMAVAGGRVQAPQIHAGALAAARLRGLPARTPAQEQRWPDMRAPIRSRARPRRCCRRRSLPGSGL
ncbi:MAG: hypothetical protein JWN08_3563 [Frankiales bacterium]|jgi:hypothetical protein|nr:hypothetical protein [Frankiales bacterium]